MLPLIAWLKSYTIFGIEAREIELFPFVQVPFKWWIYYILLKSCLARCDAWSQGLYLAKTRFSRDHCQGWMTRVDSSLS